MAKFLEGSELNSEIEKIIKNAEGQLILISPYIKLHPKIISVLQEKVEQYRLKIIIVFGKNEDDMSKSMSEEDFNIFKTLPNVEVRFEKRLHAKYYSNDFSAILTSMNLYSFSQDNNIEAGIRMKASLLGDITNTLITNFTGEESLDRQTAAHFNLVIKQSELLFQRVPSYEKIMLGFSEKYVNSKNIIDKLTGNLSSSARSEVKASNSNYGTKRDNSFIPKFKETIKLGYCIRTGKQIPFNATRPFCDEAFKSWRQYGNEDFPEKFCHYSGESSKGETSFAKPILRKNWKDAKVEHGL